MWLVARPPLVRRTGDRVVAGVAAGLAAHLGIDRRWVRGGFVVAAVFGAGLVVYVIAAVLMPGDDGTRAYATRWRPRDRVDAVALAAVVAGGALILREVAASWSILLAVPLLAGAVALTLLVSWPRADAAAPGAAGLPGWIPPGAAAAVGVLGTRRGLLLRALLGGILVLGGTAVLLATTTSWRQLRQGLLATTVVVAGVTLLFGPWVARLGSELVRERRERIRSQERAEMAAHLHDSVLQTLAMVQRRAGDPAEVARLARKQERELRAWLLGGDGGDAASGRGDSFAAAIDAHAAELEDAHGVAIDVVHVRDCALDARLRAVTLAAREAMRNAQRHACVARLAVYTEVDAREVRVYVRDRGVGFVRAEVPRGHGGLTESIEGRMRRYGGRAMVRSAPGEGTEVELVMPRHTEAAL